MSFSFRQLENQLAKSIDDDRKKQNINSTKLRAMENAVSYDDFKNLVATANLKPLDAADAKQGLQFVKARVGGKELITYSVGMVQTSEAEKKAEKLLLSAPKSKLPKNVGEWERWIISCQSVQDKVNVIGAVDDVTMTKFFLVDVDYDFLNLVILIVHEVCVSELNESYNTCCRIFKALANSKRISLVYSSLSSKTKESAKVSIEFLNEQKCISQEDLEMIRKIFI